MVATPEGYTLRWVTADLVDFTLEAEDIPDAVPDPEPEEPEVSDPSARLSA